MFRLIIFSLFLIFAFPAFGEKINAEFIQIDIINRRLTLWQGNQIIRDYPIGVGKSQQFMTPPGIYKVEVKDDSPGWVNPYNPKIKIPPGPNNPLGTRWIGFHGKQSEQVYGIHGTNEPSSVGKFVSHGCIRMLIPDSEDLFERVKIGTKVIVIYNRFEIRNLNGDISLTVYPDPYDIEPLTAENITRKIQSKFPTSFINRAAIDLIIKSNELGITRLVGYI